jgi:hypothetical protein
MSNETFFNMAQLAEASYADLWDSENNSVITDPVRVAGRLINLQTDG